MKKLCKWPVAFLTLIVLATITAPAMARDYNYISWKFGTAKVDFEDINGIGTHAGLTLNKSSFDDDITDFSIAYGYHFSQAIPVRLEIELSLRSAADYSSNDLFVEPISYPQIDSINSDINSHTMFANLYFDLLPDSSPIVPYIGGGAGIAWHVWESDYTSSWWDWDDSETSTSLAWNAGGGIALKLNNRLMIDLSYRYMDLGDAELPDLIKIEDITANEYKIGLRLTF